MPEQLRGARELSRKLRKLGPAVGGKFLRSATMRATLPALRAAQAAAPEAQPPYIYDGHAPVDPFPVIDWKGRIRLEGFGAANVKRKSRISKDKSAVQVLIGVDSAAFYMVNFVEVGTSLQAKQPWLEPSFDQNRNTMLTKLMKILKQKIETGARI